MMKITKIAVTALLIGGIGTALAHTTVAPNPKKNPTQAFHYVYDIAVTQNVADEWAAYLLGKYYETGYGTKKDIDKAYIWYSMSAVHDYKPAINALAALKKRMTASQIKKDQKQYIITRDKSIKRALADIKYSMTH